LGGGGPDVRAIVDRVFKARLEGAAPPFESTVGRAMPNLAVLGETMAATDAWYLDYAKRATAAELETVVEFALSMMARRGG